MRYLIIIAFISLVILACKNESPGELLVGTWKLKEMANSGDSMIELQHSPKQIPFSLKLLLMEK
jgi:hypothetical protein